MKLKFNSDDDLPLNKPLKLHAMAILSDVFEEGGKLYPQVFWTNAYKNYKNRNKHQTNENYKLFRLLV